MLVCEDSLFPKKQPDVSGPDLGEAGRYRMVSEPTLAVSRHIRTEVRGHEHGRVGAQMPRHVDRRMRGTDVAQGSLALDARTWHMGPLALDVWDVAKRGDPGGI